MITITIPDQKLREIILEYVKEKLLTKVDADKVTSVQILFRRYYDNELEDAPATALIQIP